MPDKDLNIEQVPVQRSTTQVVNPPLEINARERARQNTLREHEEMMEQYRKLPSVEMPKWYSWLQNTVEDNPVSRIWLNKLYDDYGKRLYNEKYNEYLTQHPIQAGTGIGYNPYIGIQYNPLVKRQQAAHDYAVKESGYIGDKSTAPYKTVDDIMSEVSIMGASMIPLFGASAGALGTIPKLVTDGYFGYEGIKGLLSPEGLAKTRNFIKQGRYGRAALSGAGDLFNLALARQGIRGVNALSKYAKDVTDVAKFNIWNKSNGFRMDYPWQREPFNPNNLPATVNTTKNFKNSFTGPLLLTNGLRKSRYVAPNTSRFSFEPKQAFMSESPEFLEELPISKGSYYRYFGEDALDSYRALGRVANLRPDGSSAGMYSMPMFTKARGTESKRSGVPEIAWAVSKPGAKLEWPGVSGIAVSPTVNGEFNKAPISDFDFYRYIPDKGFIKLDSNLNLPEGVSVPKRTSHIDYLKSLDEQGRIDYLKQNGLNEGWLWTLENNPNHLERALWQKPIPTWQDWEWNEAYNAAIENGDMELAQSLRDAHFKAKTPDNQLTEKVYHGSAAPIGLGVSAISKEKNGGIIKAQWGKIIPNLKSIFKTAGKNKKVVNALEETLPKTIEYVKPIMKPQEAATTFHWMPGIQLLSRPITLPELDGTPKIKRNQPAPANPIRISLINRSDSYLPIQDGMFTLESPEISKRLASIHFTINEPVTGHGGGNWDSASTTLMFPYGNIRKVVAPINIEPMDTFFPNYNGLQFSTKGAKVLTGDRTVHQYYTDHGVDSTFSEKIEKLLQEYNAKKGIAEKYLEEHDYLPDEEYFKLAKEESTLSDQIQQLHYDFVDQNAMRPSLEDIHKLEHIEGLRTGVEPIRDNSFADDLQRQLGYTWFSAPATHSNLLFYDPGEDISNLPKGMQEFVKWIWAHKADYRKKNGGIIK